MDLENFVTLSGMQCTAYNTWNSEQQNLVCNPIILQWSSAIAKASNSRCKTLKSATSSHACIWSGAAYTWLGLARGLGQHTHASTLVGVLSETRNPEGRHLLHRTLLVRCVPFTYGHALGSSTGVTPACAHAHEHTSIWMCVSMHSTWKRAEKKLRSIRV